MNGATDAWAAAPCPERSARQLERGQFPLALEAPSCVSSGFFRRWFGLSAGLRLLASMPAPLFLLFLLVEKVLLLRLKLFLNRLFIEHSVVCFQLLHHLIIERLLFGGKLLAQIDIGLLNRFFLRELLFLHFVRDRLGNDACRCFPVTIGTASPGLAAWGRLRGFSCTCLGLLGLGTADYPAPRGDIQPELRVVMWSVCVFIAVFPGHNSTFFQ